MSDDDDFNFFVFQTKNNPIIAHAQFPIASEGTAQWLAENVWMQRQSFFNRFFNAQTPLA